MACVAVWKNPHAHSWQHRPGAFAVMESLLGRGPKVIWTKVGTAEWYQTHLVEFKICTARGQNSHKLRFVMLTTRFVMYLTAESRQSQANMQRVNMETWCIIPISSLMQLIHSCHFLCSKGTLYGMWLHFESLAQIKVSAKVWWK